jgi:sugar-specific transcriptional regulator TrmB
MLVSDIARKAKVSRVVVYRCLEKLLDDDLVRHELIGKLKHYTAESPRRLDERMRMVESKSKQVIQQYAKEREKDVPQSTRFLHGPSGIRTAFDDAISHTRKGETFYRYTSEQDLARVNRYLARDYRIRRDKKKLERLVISNARSGVQKRPRLERFVKFIPPDADQFQQNIVQLVYGNRVSIIDLNTEQVVIIENKQLADFQKVIFTLLYKRL